MRGHIDTRHVDSDGVRYRVDIDPDPDASPNEFDCYDRDDIDAFRAGRWRYVTVTITVDSAGVDISDQLGAVEYGTCRTRASTWTGSWPTTPCRT